MRRFPLRSVLFALVLGLVASGCGNTIRPAAATVDKIEITQEELDGELKAIASNADYVRTVEQGGFEVRGGGRGTLSNAFVGRVLTRQIFLALVHREFVRQKLTVAPADLEQAKAQVVQSVGTDAVFAKFPKAYQRTLLRRNAEVAKVQAKLGGVTIDEAAVRKFYNEHLADYAQTCVSHILFSATGADGQIDQEKTATQVEPLTAAATAARAEIVAGADFAAVAAQRSADASNKDMGGELGCGGPGRFVPEFEQAMDALAPNELSQPVATQFGVHLIKVTERKPQSFEEAAPMIEQQLQGQGSGKFSGFLEDAVKKAKISINPRYGKFDKSGQAPGVVPPNAPSTTQPGDKPTRGTGAPDPLQQP